MPRRSSRNVSLDAPSPKSSFPKPWRRTEKSGSLVILWKTLVVYLVVIVLFGWLIGSASLYQFIKQRSGYTDVRYTHIVGLPWTLQAYRQAKGEFWLEAGMAAAEEGRWRDAFDQIRLGLPHVPENEEARLTLARIYLMAGRPDLAQPIILGGLAYRSDQSDYLRTVIGFLFSQQADAAVVEVAKGVLSNQALPSDARRMVAVARVYAHFNRDQYAEARAALAEAGLAQSVEGQFIEARIAWETGTPETALVMLTALHRRAPRDNEVYRTLVFYLRELGRLDEARRVVLSRQWAQPDDPNAYVDFISLCKAQENHATRANAEADFIAQFSTNPEALLKLASWAAKEGEASLAWRISALCPPNSPSAGAAVLLALEAELNAGAFAQAQVKIAEALASTQPWTALQKRVLEAWAAVAQLGRGETSEALLTLGQIAQGALIPPATLTSLASQVGKIGNDEAAERLLRRALELDPLHQPALVELLRLGLKRRSLDQDLALVERLPEMRKPPGELMYAIVQNLESDHYLFVDARRSATSRLREKLDLIRYQPSS